MARMEGRSGQAPQSWVQGAGPLPDCCETHGAPALAVRLHGPGDGSIERSTQWLVVVEGCFFNVGELPGGMQASPAGHLLRLCEAHGFEQAMRRINGDFAAAACNLLDGSVWLGRDRVGSRPLYWTRCDGSWAFASRLGALLEAPGVSRDLNRRWVAVFAGSHYRYIDNAPDETPFRDIHQVPPASVVHLRDSGVSVHRYWDLTDEPPYAADDPDLAGRYRELLLDAVGMRLAQADRPAFTLSGGMDSSSVLACAVNLTGQRQEAYSSVYTDKTYDESEEIRGFVSEKVSTWHAVPIEGFDLFETVRRMVRAHDEPVATATWLSHFLLCETVARDGFGSLFGGLGGDELNAGEYEYFVFRFADLRRAGKLEELEHEIAAWASYHDHPIYRKDRESAFLLMDRLTEPGDIPRVRVQEERLRRYQEAVDPGYFPLADFHPAMDHPFGDWLRNRTYQDIFRETAPCCLRAEDRNCQAFGLTHFDPFFDHRLIEFMFRAPGALKIRDGITKRLLREAMRGILPEETRTRVKKTGWNAPAHVWFNGPGLDALGDLVSSRAFRERGVYDIPVVQRIMAEHRRIVTSGLPQENHMMFLWQLLNLELWFQEVVDRRPGSA